MCALQPKRRVAVVGPPGSGKWTLSEQLAEKHCWCRIDVSAHSSMSSVLSSLKSAECVRGAVLHSLTSTQLRETYPELDAVVELASLPEAELRDRVSGRLWHEGSGRRYHSRLRPPKTEFVDDYTGEGLVCSLADADLRQFARRSAAFTEELRHIHSLSRSVHTVAAAGKSPEEVWRETEAALFAN